MENTSANVATNVRRLRKERGWSLAELSNRLDDAGHAMSLPVLSKLELGERGIDVDDLAALAAVLEVSPQELMTAAVDPEVRQLISQVLEWGFRFRSWEHAVKGIAEDRRALAERAGEVRVLIERLDEIDDSSVEATVRNMLEQALGAEYGARAHEELMRED